MESACDCSNTTVQSDTTTGIYGGLSSLVAVLAAAILKMIVAKKNRRSAKAKAAEEGRRGYNKNATFAASAKSLFCSDSKE